MNTQINITKNGTTTLATEGKYCDRNIDVNVNVDGGGEDVMAKLAQGTIEGEYASDEVLSLRTGAFCDCPNLTSVSLPNCTAFNGFRQFANCTSITALNLPKLETITNGNQNFASAESLEEINLPSLTTISGSSATFNGCKNLSTVIMPLLSGSTIGASCFYNCYYLHTVVLGGETLNPLGNTNAFGNAGRNTELSIYVPDALVDTYKAATNWTAYADKIKPISELEGQG